LLELLVIVRVPFLIIARPQVSVPLNTLPVAHYRKGGTTAHLTLYPGRSLKKNGLATNLSSNCWLLLPCSCSLVPSRSCPLVGGKNGWVGTRPLQLHGQSDFGTLHVIVVEF